MSTRTARLLVRVIVAVFVIANLIPVVLLYYTLPSSGWCIHHSRTVLCVESPLMRAAMKRDLLQFAGVTAVCLLVLFLSETRFFRRPTNPR